jgi:hypothetical protein
VKIEQGIPRFVEWFRNRSTRTDSVIAPTA